MPSWKQINEVGGAVIGRAITGLFACLCLYGLVTVTLNGRPKVGSFLVLTAGLILFGGYTVVGNRMNRFVEWAKLKLPGHDNGSDRF